MTKRKLFVVLTIVAATLGVSQSSLRADPAKCNTDESKNCHTGSTNKPVTIAGRNCTSTSATVTWMMCVSTTGSGTTECKSKQDNCIWTETFKCPFPVGTISGTYTNTADRTYAGGNSCP